MRRAEATITGTGVLVPRLSQPMESEVPATALTDYEERQVAGIIAWKTAEPNRLERLMNSLTRPLAWLAHLIVPERVLRNTLDLGRALAQRLTDERFVLHRAQLSSLDELSRLDLEAVDRLAISVQRRSIGLAAAQGACTGALGLPGVFLDIPVVIAVALRTIHRIGLCYGFDVRGEADVQYVHGILAAAGANTRLEKNAAVGFIQSVNSMVFRRAWMREGALAMNVGEAGASVAFRTLARQLGVNLSKRQCFSVVPVIGGVIAAASNAIWVRHVGWAARRAFQERWLLQRGKPVAQATVVECLPLRAALEASSPPSSPAT